MIYLFKIDMNYAAKNKLHQEIQNYIESLNRFVVPEYRLKVFQEDVVHKISKLVEKFPRCTPVKQKWWNDNDGDHHLSLSGQSIISATLYHGDDTAFA